MSTERTLVIVTCHKDKWKFEMLCRSMKLFLEPCNIIIVYNEIKSKYEEWLEWFAPINSKNLKKFGIVMHNAEDLYPDELYGSNDPVYRSGGWVKQQVLKLLVAQKIKTPKYIIIDSKNFFIKKCNINNIDNTYPHGYWTLPGVTQWTKACCKKLDLIYPGHQLKLRANTTPYIFKTNVARRLVKRFGSNLDFVMWFNDTSRRPDVSPAEFILYELFELKTNNRDWDGTRNNNNTTLWMHYIHREKMDIEQLAEHIKTRSDELDICVSGFHSGMHDLLTYEDVKYILTYLGIDFILPMDRYGPF